jgi:periplasmic divalent cation tolerance protein
MAPKPSNFMVVLCTCPDQATAEHIARVLVEERLAACVNVLPNLTSVYRWRGQVETAAEVLLLAKSSADAFADIEGRVRGLHPYELPEIIAVPLSDGSAAYLAWISEARGEHSR